ncbi:MAG: hypothetical protein JSR26_02600 [Proteobacteria bacterium]|nr:hypothetical protein [Pseudomonadota bacterium]
MLRLIAFLIVIGALALLVRLQYKAQYLTLQEHQERQHVAASSAAEQPQLQCAQAALGRFHQLGLDDKPGSSHTAHFNARLNQCYQLMETQRSDTGTNWRTATLYDAQGRVFASYGWRGDTGRPASSISPYTCTVTLPSGEHRDCGSQTEFRRLIDTYMAN